MSSQILVEFLFRLTFGVATAMGITPARQATSGFFRVHLWVLLGVQTLAALALYSTASSAGMPIRVTSAQFWLAVAAAAASYVGAVIWMYERTTAGKVAIWLVAASALAGTALPSLFASGKPVALQLADRVSGGLLLGAVTTAMLLGHWYLNTPTMKLGPFKRLLLLLAAAILLRMVVCAVGTRLEIAAHAQAGQSLAQAWYLFLALRWLAGLVGVLWLTWLTWLTLKIPNTQSATGILYAGVVLVFIGELTSQLLSSEARYPL